MEKNLIVQEVEERLGKDGSTGVTEKNVRSPAK